MKNIQKINFINFDIQITSYTGVDYSEKGNPSHYEFIALDKTTGKEIWGSDVTVTRQKNYETNQFYWATAYSSTMGDLEFIRIKGNVLNFAYDFITKL